MDVPAGWVLQQSRKTGASYFWHAATSRSLWHDATLPLGWGWEAAGPGAPREFVHLATLERRTERPTGEAMLPASETAAPPPEAPSPSVAPETLHAVAPEASTPMLVGVPVIDEALLPPGVPQPSISNVAFDV